MADADYDDSTFVTIGTPFQPLEEEGNEDNKIVYARDRKPGETYRERRERQRFHGAFTGGFSAGYYNTVGSKEGWMPSTFISSRKGKSEAVSHKPEDFMDSEDFGRFGIAPRRVAPTREFTLDSQDADELGRILGKRQTHTSAAGSALSDLFGGNFLKDLVVPTRTSIGVTLLKRMGWKEGQGIGPKSLKKTSDTQGPPKVYGCSLPSKEDNRGNERERFLLAPGDIKPWILAAKDDLHGIGYSGIMEERIEGMRGKTHSSHLYGMFGQAFGIGALEEEDDEDVYASENITDYNLATVGEGELEREEKFGWTGPHSTEGWSMKAFIKSRKALKLQKVYPPPVLPKGYTPKQAVMSSDSRKGDDLPRRHRLDATTRGHLIGETASVFSMLKPEDRARIPQRKPEVEPKHESNSKWDRERNSKWERESSSKWNRWDQPASSAPETRPGRELFSHDQKKQSRFKAFQQNSSAYYELAHNMTEWEVQKEREEFAKMAALQTQLGKSLSSKFAKEGEGEREKGSKSTSDEKGSTKSKDRGTGKTGRPVREVLEWHPHRILCKRLDVPDPFPHSHVVGLMNKEKKSTKMDQFVNEAKTLQWSLASGKERTGHPPSSVETVLQTGGGLIQPSATASTAVAEKSPESIQEKRKDSSSDEVTMEQGVTPSDPEERPPMDIFKAIFAESESDDSSTDSEEEEESKQEELQSQEMQYSKEQTNTIGSHGEELPARDNPTHTMPNTQQPIDRTSVGKISPQDSCTASKDRHEAVEGNGSYADNGDHAVAMEVSTRKEGQPVALPVTYGPALPPSYNEESSDEQRSRSHDRNQQVQEHKHHHKKEKRKHTHKEKKSKHKRHKHKVH